jgi:hypothetical protein
MIPIVDPTPTSCKICQSPSPLFGVVDFHKSCIETTGRGLSLSGNPIYYRRCKLCAFTFTDAFDAWSPEAFRKHIYNETYAVIDPDYAELRPKANATLIAETFGPSRLQIRILDYGGGTGLLAQQLRSQSFSAETYDPFTAFTVKPISKFHLITCFEVMEHVPFPIDTVSTMVALLEDQGAILFSTLLQPPTFETTGLDWWYASPRNGHMSLYSHKALAHLFRPHAMKVTSFSDALHLAYTTIPPFAAHLKLPPVEQP